VKKSVKSREEKRETNNHNWHFLLVVFYPLDLIVQLLNFREGRSMDHAIDEQEPRS